MAYQAHNWVNNEVITVSKLNHIEKGIESAPIALVVEIVEDTYEGGDTYYRLSETWNTINNVYINGGQVFIKIDSGDWDQPSYDFVSYSLMIPYIQFGELNCYKVVHQYYSSFIIAGTDNPDGYPVE